MLNVTGGRRRAIVRAALLSVLICGAAVSWVFVASELRLFRTRDAPLHETLLPTNIADIERGRHLGVHVALCAWCHGDDLGGKLTADDPWVGRLHASNLTSGPGGAGARYSDVDFDRAIRYGVAPSGRSLLLMPSHYFHELSPADSLSIIAWIRTVPPVASDWPETWAGPLTRLALVLGLAPELIAAEQLDRRIALRAENLAERPAVERGEGAHLVDLGSCRVCHHPDLSGGLHPLALPGEPPPSDLRASGPLSAWTREDFVRAMRAGVTPDGRQLSPEYMPWPHFAGMTDDELDAIWRYLRNPAPSESSQAPGS